MNEDPSSKKELEEEHTREIEIENVFRMYQQALALQQAGDWLRSYAVWQKLAASPVISGHYYEETEFVRGAQNGSEFNVADTLSHVAPNVKNIRYLYLRNRGLLHLSLMRAGPGVLDKVRALEREADSGAAAADVLDGTLDVVDVDAGALVDNTEEMSVDTEKGIKSSEVARDEGDAAEAPFLFFKELFYSMLDNLVSCMMYQEPDDTVLRLLFDVYVYLDFRRLARLTLDLACSFSAESDDIMSIIPINNWAAKLRKVFGSWERFADVPHLHNVHEKLAFLEPIRRDLDAQYNKIYALRALEVPLKADSKWADVLQAVNVALKRNQDRDKARAVAKGTDLDPYLASEYPCDYVQFTFTTEDVPRRTNCECSVEVLEGDSRKEAADSVDAPEPTPAEKKPMGAEPEPLEKASMRVSRRLNPDDLNPIFADDIVLTRRYFAETEAFFEQINALYRDVTHESTPVLNDVIEAVISAEPAAVEPLYVMDLLRMLNEWKTNFYDAILLGDGPACGPGASANSDKVKLIEVLTRFGNQSSVAQTINESLDDTQDNAYIRAFLSELTAARSHVSVVRARILANLFLTVVNNSWSADLGATVSDWVLQSELEFYNRCCADTRLLDEPAHMDLAIGIYELLVNLFIAVKNQIDETLEGAESAKSGKGTANVSRPPNAVFLRLMALKDRLHKWERHLGDFMRQLVRAPLSDRDLTLVIRFYWVSDYYLASKSMSWPEKKLVVIHLDALQRIVAAHARTDIEIPFTNYAFIGEFSFEALHRRHSTASILALFSKILDDSGGRFDSQDDTIALLEAILIVPQDCPARDCPTSNTASDPVADSRTKHEIMAASHSLVDVVMGDHATLDASSLATVRDFLNECPVNLRLSLWSILFLCYEKVSMQRFKHGFEQYLQFMLAFLTGPAYRGAPRERSQLLLQLLSFYGGYLKVFLRHLASVKWALPHTEFTAATLHNLARVFELSYCFSLHEESALITGCKVSLETKSAAAFRHFKDLMIENITLFLVYLFSAVRRRQPQHVESFISTMVILVHSQLGIRRLCEASGGVFLKFAEDLLVGLRDVPDHELAQILSCRFHYKVKLNGQFPTDHYTEKVGQLDRSSAHELANFILPFCFRNNPLKHAPRNDIKQVVEDLYEIIGDPIMDDAQQANLARVRTFCDQTMFTPRFVKTAMHGLLHVALEPQKPVPVAKNGLYFMQALLMLNFYKMRKKSAQSRIVELDKIVVLLHIDLSFGGDRVESWILLGQAYGYLVEDDLIWTSDKLNSAERKALTANLQRKALVSYLMAVSTVVRQRGGGGSGAGGVDGQNSENTENAPETRPLVGLLMNALTKELYSACLPPMDMLAFAVYPAPRLVRKSDGTTTTALARDNLPVSRTFCLRLMHRCASWAVRCCPDDWAACFYLGKILAKLQHDAHAVLALYKRASDLAKGSGAPGDLVVEPAYKYYCLVYKYVKRGQLALGDALLLVNLGPMVMMDVAPATVSEESVYVILVNAFARLQALDKRAWYHKPAYRQAYVVLHEFDDLSKAKEIMWKYFSLKSNSKLFLQLWKPENERPGKHFVYMYQYTRFYTTVLLRERDLTSLVHMFQKVRRANSTMVLLYYAWEHVCSAFCRLLRQVFGIEENSVENFLAGHNQHVFVAQGRSFVDSFTTDDASEVTVLVLCSLNVLSEMRKLNNGFGPTSLIDDTFIAFFLMVFIEQISGHHVPVDPVPVPPGKTRRLAKKDLFPFAIELTAKCKRFTDAYLKENPCLFNEYVAGYVLRMKQMWAMQRFAEHQQRLQALTCLQRINYEQAAARQWCLFELKLSMKKMLYCTIPDSKKLIQEDEDELMELASVQPVAPDLLHAFACSYPQTFSARDRLSAVVAQNPLFTISAAPGNTAVSPKKTMAGMSLFLGADRPQSFPSENTDSTAQNTADNPETNHTPALHRKKAAKHPNVVFGLQTAKTVAVRTNRQSTTDRTAGSQREHAPDPEVVEIDSGTSTEVPTRPETQLRPSPQPQSSLSLLFAQHDAAPCTPTKLVDNSSPVLPAVQTDFTVTPIVLDNSIQDRAVAIEEPNEPIFVPRRRSSRQRESLLKSRLNGLSKDVPIVVEVDDEGPKRPRKTAPELAAKRKRTK